MSCWFVILCGNDMKTALPRPLVVGGEGEDWDDSFMLFDTEQEAMAAGEANGLGRAFGFEVYEWPYEVPKKAGGGG